MAEVTCESCGASFEQPQVANNFQKLVPDTSRVNCPDCEAKACQALPESSSAPAAPSAPSAPAVSSSAEKAGKGGFMGWLKKVGQVVLKIVGIGASLLPMVSGISPVGIGSELAKIAKVLVTVEQVSTAMQGPDAKTGSQKLRAAVPQVAAIIQTSELMVGKKIKDEAAFEQACTNITSGFADLLNSLEE